MFTPITPATRSGYCRAMIHTSRPPQSWPAITTCSRADRVDDAHQARVDPVAVVGDVGLVAAAVAREVGRDHVEPGRTERGDLVPPRVRELGEAVQQQHARTVGRAGLQAEQADAVGGDVATLHVGDRRRARSHEGRPDPGERLTTLRSVGEVSR